MVTLRPLKENDITLFATWWRDSKLIKVTSGDFSPLSDKDVERYFQSILTSKGALHFMIEVNGETIGHISLSKSDDDWWETQIVIGTEDAQGKGFGTEAIRLLIEVAHSRNINNIYLNVRPENTKATKAYEKAGFKQVGNMSATDNSNQPLLIRMELEG